MPRKQRFKPSRKPPQQNQGTVVSPQVDDRKETHPEREIEGAIPPRGGTRDVERGQE